MNQTTALKTSTNEDTELQTGISQYLTEIEDIRRLMSYDQIEIDLSQKRTHTLLAEIKATLSPTVPRAA